MSDALVEIDENDPDLMLVRAETEANRAPRKKRNISRRQVVNLSDEMSYWLKAHSREISGGIVITSAIRLLLAEALRARGVTPAMMRAEYQEHLAREARAAAEADSVAAQ